MSHKDFTRDFIIRWNNLYPLDRVYRKKYNIGFGSSAHRKLNQLDVYLDWLEDHIYEEYIEIVKVEEQEKKDFKAGKWLKEQADIVSEEEADNLFDNFDVTNISSQDNKE